MAVLVSATDGEPLRELSRELNRKTDHGRSRFDIGNLRTPVLKTVAGFATSRNPSL